MDVNGAHGDRFVRLHAGTGSNYGSYGEYVVRNKKRAMEVSPIGRLSRGSVQAFITSKSKKLRKRAIE